jgi:hypothetical protein
MSNVTGFWSRLGRIARGCSVALACLGISEIGRADVPNSVSFQGVALDRDGGPINGNRDVQVRIYDQPSSPANLIYAESHLATPFLDGVFQLVIGIGTSQSGDFALAWGQGTRWLEVEIAGEILSPRTQFHAVPYARMCRAAETIAGIDTAELVQNVSPGPGLGGGGSGESVTLFVDFTQTQQRVGGSCPVGSSIRQINADGSVICEADSGGSGDITAVTAGSGLVGGGASGDVSLSIGTNMVTGAMIQNSTISTADIAVDAIDSFRIANGAVTGADIADGSVNTVDLAPAAVGSAQIGNNSILAEDIQAGAIGSPEVLNDSLRAIDMLDESGADFSGGDQSLSITGVDNIVRSVSITAPAAGKVIVSASGTFWLFNVSTAESGSCSITTGSTVDASHEFRVSEPVLNEHAMSTIPFSSIRGFSVNAGTTTFNLVCSEEQGELTVLDSEMTAIFVSTTY